jgi:adenine-specific DNA-methyltransferase
MLTVNEHIHTLEADYISSTDCIHRKKYAQFFTPKPIANLLCNWLMQHNNLKTVLEPAFGLGVFSRILLNEKPDIQIKGYDIDSKIFNEAKVHFSPFENVELYLKDYMFNDWKDKYDGIVCNPPYFKFHDYNNKEVLKEIEKNLEFKPNGFTNLYTLFLIKSIHQLKANGRTAFIIPSEFLNSDYGKLIKDYLLKSNTLRHLFIIDFEENVFDNALTTACVLLLARDKNSEEINFSNISTVADLSKIETYIDSYPFNTGEYVYKTDSIVSNVKWRTYYQEQHSCKYKNLVPFTNYAKVVRGIATGANDYFTLRNSKIKSFSIPQENLVPCICKAKDVKSNFFTSLDFNKLKADDELTYLFNGKNSNKAKVRAYILKGENEKINERYLTKSRKPWFALENRPPAPIWVSVFNRNGIKFIRNEANVSNLTTFHCVYPKKEDLFSKNSVDLFFAYLLTDVAKEIFSDNRREYGNGLKKFEPNDLNTSKMLDLSLLSKTDTENILALYYEYRKNQKEKTLKQIDAIFRKKFSNF